jgi:hypothetical protein
MTRLGGWAFIDGIGTGSANAALSVGSASSMVGLTVPVRLRQVHSMGKSSPVAPSGLRYWRMSW